MSYTDDPIADFHNHCAEQEKQLEKLPRCSECDHPIQDKKCYSFNGELICEQCLEDNHEKNTEDFIY